MTQALNPRINKGILIEIDKVTPLQQILPWDFATFQEKHEVNRICILN